LRLGEHRFWECASTGIAGGIAPAWVRAALS
jgi:hypothetical protein